MSQKRLYIVAKNSSLEETKNNARVRLEKLSKINVLCFDDSSVDKVISKTTDLFEKHFGVAVDKVDVFNESYLSGFSERTSGYNVFYFPRIGKYDYFKKALAKNNIIEDDFELVAERKFASISFVLKRDGSYHKLFTIDRGNDDSVYIKFEDNYIVRSCTRDINDSGTVNLKPFLKELNSPYVSYHSSGVIHSNDDGGSHFIDDLASHGKDYILQNDFMFPLCTILPSLHQLRLLRNIGEPPLTRDEFNYIVLGDNFTIKNVVSGLKKQTFVCTDTDFLLPDKFMSFEIWIHKNIEGASIFPSLDEWQKKNAFNCITFSNKDSSINYSVILRRVEANKDKRDKKFNIICTLGSRDEFLAYGLELKQ